MILSNGLIFMCGTCLNSVTFNHRFTCFVVSSLRPSVPPIRGAVLSQRKRRGRRPPDKTCQGHGKPWKTMENPWKTSVKPGNFEHSIPGTGMISKFVLKQLEIIVNPPWKSKSFHEDGWWYNLPARMWKDSQEKLKQWWTEPRAPRPAGAPHHQARFVATRWWSVVGLYLTTTGLYSRYNIRMEVS